MSLAGPRLDRPSAIGDEGRPRAASLWIATLVVVCVVGAAGVAIGEPSLLPTLATVVGLTVAGIALLDRAGFGQLFVGHAFLLTAGSALALLVCLAPFAGRTGVAVSGFALALLGIGAAWADIGGDDVSRAAASSAIGYVSLLFSIALLAVVGGAAFVGWRGLATVTDASTPIVSVGGVALVGCVTGCAVLLALRWLPVRQLTRRDRRPVVDRRLATLRRVLQWTVVGSILVVVAVASLHFTGWGDDLSSRQPALAAALEALSAPVVIWPLVAIGGVSLLAGGVALALRRLTQRVSTETTRRSAAILVGVALTFVLPFVGLLLLVSPVVATIVVVVLFAGPVVFCLLAGGGHLCVALGLLPARTTGPAVAATGLVIAAAGLGRGRPALVFACIAGAVLVWDCSTYGLGVTAELGHVPETRRLELFHGAIAVGVVVAAVVVALGLETIRTGIGGRIGGASAVVALALGAVLLLAPVRG